MLTADLVRPRLYTRKGELRIRWLPAKGEALDASGDLIRLFGKGLGQRMREWSAALEAYEGARTDYTILRGLAKVLEDGATFTPVETPVDPVALRQAVFAHGPVFSHADLFRKTRPDALGEVSTALGLTVEQMEAALYADRPAEYLLADLGPVWTPDSLIARYNLELARAALYWATELRIDIHDGYKDFWHFLKLFKLMFWATPLPEGGYHVTLDGPISPFVHSTTRYGRQFAVFLPALLLGQQWSMVADVRLPGESKTLYYRLDATTPLKTHFKGGGEFDSRMEADFAAEFEAKFGGERGGWTLKREDEVLLLGDTVMIPDFSVTNKADGRRALIEIVGFWHPEYLNRKLEKVRAANRHDLILLVYEGVNLTEDRLLNVPGEVLYFAKKPVLKDVMAAVERSAVLS
jgi:predicted nuclease of restriction endonuclease-like RecB superfamily